MGNPGFIRIKFKSLFARENILPGLIILIGILLRIRQYLTGRSLWVDEAMLALNIVNRNFAGLFKPLDYDQGAPIGFLLVEKTFNVFLGRNEFALRLFPLIVGIISLGMFYLLLKRFTSGFGLSITLALFALNPRLIYYSSEVKQYILDAAVTMALLLVAVSVFERPSRKGLSILAVAGLLALWFSHPSLFILAGIGISLIIFFYRKHDTASLGIVAGMGMAWLANTYFLYSLTLDNLSQNSYMREYWQSAFAPMPPWADLNWYLINFQKNMDTNFSIWYASWFVLLLMLIGWALLFTRRRPLAITIAGIIFFTLLASSLGLYPTLERMVLFLTPIGLILLGALLDYLWQRAQIRPFFGLLLLILSVYFLYGPVTRSYEQFVSSKYSEHIRPSMEYLQSSWKASDAMYVSHGAVPAFEYYAPMYGLQDIAYISGQREDYQNPDDILKRLEPLKGKGRVWILLSHVYEKGNFNEKDFLTSHLNQMGHKIREFRIPGTSVFLYLYDLSE